MTTLPTLPPTTIDWQPPAAIHPEIDAARPMEIPAHLAGTVARIARLAPTVAAAAHAHKITKVADAIAARNAEDQ